MKKTLTRALSEGGFDEQGRFFHIPFGNLQRMAEVFRRRVIALFLERRLIDRSRAASMLSWHHSGFSLDGSIGLYAGDQKTMKRLAQYTARPPISLSKMVLEERGGKGLFQSAHCGSPTKLLGLIMDPVEADKILRHLLKTGRAPPGLKASLNPQPQV